MSCFQPVLRFNGFPRNSDRAGIFPRDVKIVGNLYFNVDSKYDIKTYRTLQDVGFPWIDSTH